MEVKRIGVLSVGKVMGAMYVVIGLILGGLLSLFALAGGGAGPNGPAGPAPAALFGAAAIIILPLLYGVLGFIGGIITGALYNLVASTIGGIEMELTSYTP